MGLDALVLADEDGTDDPDGRTAVFTVNEGAAMVGLYNEVVQKTDSFTAAKKVEEATGRPSQEGFRIRHRGVPRSC